MWKKNTFSPPEYTSRKKDQEIKTELHFKYGLKRSLRHTIFVNVRFQILQPYFHELFKPRFFPIGMFKPFGFSWRLTHEWTRFQPSSSIKVVTFESYLRLWYETHLEDDTPRWFRFPSSYHIIRCRPDSGALDRRSEDKGLSGCPLFHDSVKWLILGTSPISHVPTAKKGHWKSQLSTFCWVEELWAIVDLPRPPTTVHTHRPFLGAQHKYLKGFYSLSLQETKHSITVKFWA